MFVVLLVVFCNTLRAGHEKHYKTCRISRFRFCNTGCRVLVTSRFCSYLWDKLAIPAWCYKTVLGSVTRWACYKDVVWGISGLGFRSKPPTRGHRGFARGGVVCVLAPRCCRRLAIGGVDGAMLFAASCAKCLWDCPASFRIPRRKHKKCSGQQVNRKAHSARRPLL